MNLNSELGVIPLKHHQTMVYTTLLDDPHQQDLQALCVDLGSIFVKLTPLGLHYMLLPIVIYYLAFIVKAKCTVSSVSSSLTMSFIHWHLLRPLMANGRRLLLIISTSGFNVLLKDTVKAGGD